MTLPRCPAFLWHGITSYLEFDGSNSLLRPTEFGLDFYGDLTIWAWVRFHPESTGIQVDYFSKWLSPDDRTFMLSKTNADVLNFNITNDGATVFTVSAAAADYSANVDKWLFIVGRYVQVAVPNEISLFVGFPTSGTFNWYKNAIAIPTYLWISACNLMVGASEDGNNIDGDMTLFGMSTGNLTDIYIQNMFSQSRPLFVI